MTRLRTSLLALFVGALVAAPAPAGALTYVVDRTIDALEVSGTIETDGTLGVLASANITGFDLSITIGGSVPSNLFVSGSNLTATATGLFFDFDASGTTKFGAWDADADGYTKAMWTLNSGGEGALVDPDDSDDSVFGTGGSIARSGDIQIATIPEPSTAVPIGPFAPLASAAALLSLGLVGLAATRRRGGAE